MTALAMRRAVLVQLAPERATLYRLDNSGQVFNKFRLKIANRGAQPASVAISSEGLPNARILVPVNPIVVEPGATSEQFFEIATVPFAGSQDVNHFRIVVATTPGADRQSFDETFIMPVERTKP